MRQINRKPTDSLIFAPLTPIQGPTDNLGRIARFVQRANGPHHTSPGQRPGNGRNFHGALTGRTIGIRNDETPLQGFPKFGT